MQFINAVTLVELTVQTIVVNLEAILMSYQFCTMDFFKLGHLFSV